MGYPYQCLLPHVITLPLTHIHTPKGNLSRCMRHVNGVYTQRFNRTHGLDGQLFRGRYKSIIVGGDCYPPDFLNHVQRQTHKLEGHFSRFSLC